MAIPTRQDIQTAVLKTGIGEFPRWVGMRTEGDPSANQFNQPRMLVNLRPSDGGGYTDRGTWVKYNASVYGSATSCIKGVFDLDGSTAASGGVRLYIVTAGCPGLSASAGFGIVAIDPEQEPEFQNYRYYNSATGTVRIGALGDDIYTTVDGNLYLFQVIRLPRGIVGLTATGRGAERLIKTFTGTFKAIQEFDGYLFLALDNGAGTSSIQTYDGITIKEDLAAAPVPSCFGLYHEPFGAGALGRDALVVGFSAANEIRYRPPGAPVGTWTSVAPGAGTIAGAVEMLAYRDKLYIVKGTDDVWAWDAVAGTLAAIPVATTGIPAASTCSTLAVVQGKLHVGYTSASTARLATFDGTTWTGTAKNLTTQFANAVSMQRFRFYRGFVMALCTSGTGVARIYVARDIDVTTSSWTEVAMAGSAVGGVVDAVVI